MTVFPFSSVDSVSVAFSKSLVNESGSASVTVTVSVVVATASGTPLSSSCVSV